MISDESKCSIFEADFLTVTNQKHQKQNKKRKSKEENFEKLKDKTMHTNFRILVSHTSRYEGIKTIIKKYCSILNDRLVSSYEPAQEIWNESILQNLETSFRVIPNFITENEEKLMIKEVEPHLKRLIYEKDHWDEAIVKFRETERKHWNENNQRTIDRLKSTSFHSEDKLIPYVHVLDLAEDGYIKAHIDSTRVNTY